MVPSPEAGRYEVPGLDECISAEEWRERVTRTQIAIDEEGLDGLVAYGDCLRASNVTYFTDFRPRDGISDASAGLVVIPVSGDPTLFVSEACLPWASHDTWFQVKPFRELERELGQWAGMVTTVGLAGADFIPAKLHARLTASLDARLHPSDVLANVKAVKSEPEIRLLRRAAELTDGAMATIREVLSDGEPHSERELARLADAGMILQGADETGFGSMIQSGPRSAFPLARPTDRVLKPGELVMTDIGARYRGYVADGGRGFTYGHCTDEKLAIVEAAAAAVEAGLAVVRPGIGASDVNAVIQQSLLDSGYERFSGEARGQGTGHGTGMDPEEEIPWIGPGSPTILSQDMVFTLKATITVPGTGGLRTERIVRVTGDGVETLDNFEMRLHW